MLWLILTVLIVLGIFLLTRRDRKMVLLYNQLPCDTPQWPIIGHLHNFLGNSDRIMKTIQILGKETTKKGGIMGLWRLNALYIMITDAVTSEYILKHCLAKDDIVELTWIVMGNASIFAPVPIWRPRRKLLTSVFKAKKLDGFVDIFSKHSLVLVDKLKSVSGNDAVSIWEYLITYSMDALCKTTMGIDVNSQENKNNPFLIAITELFEILVERATKPWLQSDFLLKLFHPKVIKYKQIIYDFIEKLIEARLKSAELQATDNSNINTNPSKTFIDMMIESSNKEQGYSNLALQEEIIVLLLGGTDTSATGLAFTMLMLSRYPHVQKKVYQELQEVFGDSDRPVAAEDLPRLKYLEAVIKESLRLHPPGAYIVRKVDNDLSLPSGVTLVKGCGIIINIWGIHRNPRYWGPDAEEFRPERFIETSLKHTTAYMPFSYGPRGCIGFQFAYMSMKVVIANIVRRFRILPAPHPVTGLNLHNNNPLKAGYGEGLICEDKYVVSLKNR